MLGSARLGASVALAAAAMLITAPAALANPKYEETFVQKYGMSVCADLKSSGSGQRTFWTIHSYYLSELAPDLNYSELQYAMGTAVARYCPQYYNDYETYLRIYSY